MVHSIISTMKDFINTKFKANVNKFALLWGEAQLCLPLCLLIEKIAYNYLKVT